jgi:CubicO group peptidase (beta-lactamase class C family)
MTKARSLKLLGSDLQATLDRLRKKHGVCGVSLAILKDGVIHAAASGWANAPERVEATPDTLFQIGSISKTFTATLAMQLVDEGSLDLDAPVRRYLPDFATADAATATLTVRDLLMHTSGMDGDYLPPDSETGGTAEGYVRGMSKLGQLHAPGEYMTYCNSGYVVLTRIVEVLRKNTWNQLVLDRICKPLGMTRVLTQPTEALRFRMAMGHGTAVKGQWPLAAFAYLPMSMAGCGSVLSMTASDLLLYAQAHMRGPSRNPTKTSILSRRAFSAMHAPQVLMPPYSRGVYTHMGLSWFLRPDKAAPAFNHDGGTSQYAFLHALPKQGVAFALFINSPNAILPEQLRKAIFTEIAGLPAKRKPNIPPAISFDPKRCVGSYAGIFQSIEVAAGKAGHLKLKMETKGMPLSMSLNLRAVAPDEFAILDKPQADQDARILFLGEQEGRAKYCRMGVRMIQRASD